MFGFSTHTMSQDIPFPYDVSESASTQVTLSATDRCCVAGATDLVGGGDDVGGATVVGDCERVGHELGIVDGNGELGSGVGSEVTDSRVGRAVGSPVGFANTLHSDSSSVTDSDGLSSETTDDASSDAGLVYPIITLYPW